jgi:hypothetical protein
MTLQLFRGRRQRRTAALWLFAVGALVGLGLLAVAPGTASAHERRTVGPYTFVVGFLNEPAFEGDTNGIDLRITRTAGEEPVEGAEKTLQAEVVVGGSTLPLELRPRFRQPGAYNGEFVPTRPGAYLFRFSGTIDGQPVNESFESGPGRFNDVQAVGPLQFPDKVSSGVEVQRALAAADSRANTAMILGGIGLLAGLAGLVLAAWALASRRGAPSAVGAGTPSSRPAAVAPQERL